MLRKNFSVKSATKYVYFLVYIIFYWHVRLLVLYKKINHYVSFSSSPSPPNKAVDAMKNSTWQKLNLSHSSHRRNIAFVQIVRYVQNIKKHMVAIDVTHNTWFNFELLQNPDKPSTSTAKGKNHKIRQQSNHVKENVVDAVPALVTPSTVEFLMF